MNSKFSKYIPIFDENCNKYTRGHVVIFAGSIAYPGAAVLCSKAAGRSGAGYVELFTLEPIKKDIALKLENIVVRGLKTNSKNLLSKKAIDEIHIKKCDSILIGPGISKGDAQDKLLKSIIEFDIPTVVDADSISSFTSIIKHTEVLDKINQRRAPIILTPHAGELRHLLAYANNININEWNRSKLVNTVQKWMHSKGLENVVIVAKGPDTTVISYKENKTVTSGTSSLATAGTGDVLAGCIASFLAQSNAKDIKQTLNECCAAVETHAIAGQISALSFGKHGVMAGDVANALGTAIDALLV